MGQKTPCITSIAIKSFLLDSTGRGKGQKGGGKEGRKVAFLSMDVILRSSTKLLRFKAGITQAWGTVAEQLPTPDGG